MNVSWASVIFFVSIGASNALIATQALHGRVELNPSASAFLIHALHFVVESGKAVERPSNAGSSRASAVLSSIAAGDDDADARR